MSFFGLVWLEIEGTGLDGFYSIYQGNPSIHLCSGVRRGDGGTIYFLGNIVHPCLSSGAVVAFVE